MLIKQDATRRVRDALAESFPGDVTTRRRAATCYGVVRDAYVIFNVQHRQYKPEVGLMFAVNWSVLPVRLFDANPRGLFGSHPREHDAHIFARGRLLHDPQKIGDRWFDPQTQQDLNDDIEEIRRSASRYWDSVFPPMLSNAWYVSQLRALKKHPGIDDLIQTVFDA